MPRARKRIAFVVCLASLAIVFAFLALYPVARDYWKKQELASMLKRSVTEWNEWRESRFGPPMTEVDSERLMELWNLERSEPIDLSGVDLRSIDLKLVNLSGVDLTAANLSEASLSGNLNDVCLRGANLRGADIFFADLVGADLRGADLLGIRHWKQPNLKGANILGIKNAPPGFREWALKNGAVELPGTNGPR